jgi:glycine/D-amino acid oxidase-like deaminating enzyme
VTLHFAEDAPYWHREAPLDSAEAQPIAEKADVAIIGGGFTGLSCALELARLGRSVVVLEAREPGFGASTRNGGMLGWGHRADLSKLEQRYGAEAARAIMAEGPVSLAFTLGLMEREGIDCDLQHTGRFLAAASPRHFNKIRRDVETVFQPMGVACRVVEPQDQGAEISTQVYCGGAVFDAHHAVHPGKFHRGLLAAALRSGAKIASQAAVTEIERSGEGWRVETVRGEVTAREVVFAANGYAAQFSKALKPFADTMLTLPSFLIATQRLGQNRVKALMPGGRMYVDTRSSHSYFRPSPDGERILWGGRASLTPLVEATATDRLRRHMSSVFPELADTGIDDSWTGRIAYSRDGVAQIGKLNGIWYAGGYCGSGIAMAPFQGWRLAQKIAGTDEAASPFDVTSLRGWPPSSLMPLGIRAFELWHRYKDRREGVLAPIAYR